MWHLVHYIATEIGMFMQEESYHYYLKEKRKEKIKIIKFSDLFVNSITCPHLGQSKVIIVGWGIPNITCPSPCHESYAD